jgi:hypothetical protein
MKFRVGCFIFIGAEMIVGVHTPSQTILLETLNEIVEADFHIPFLQPQQNNLILRLGADKLRVGRRKSFNGIQRSLGLFRR